MSRRSGSSKGSRNSKKTKGSDRSKNKIELDKDPDLNLDKPDDIELDDKESGGNFGELSTELGLWEDEESGQSVSAVAGVDVVPLGVSISANGDIGSVGVDIGLPGDVIGVSANLQIDLETGDIIGGGGAIDYGGVSVGVDQIRKDGETCTTVTVTYMGIGASYQRCRKDDDDDEKDPKKDPPPNSEENDIPDPTPKPIPPGYTGWVCPLVSYTTVSIALTDSYWTSFLATIIDLKYIGVAPANLVYPIGDDKNPPYYYGGNAYNGGGSTELTSYVLPETYKSGFLYADPEILDVKKEYDLVTIDSPNYQDITGDQRQFKAGENCFKIVKRKWADWFGVKVKDDPIYYHGTGIRCYYVKNYQPPEPPKDPDPPIPPEDDMSKCCDLEPVMSLLRKVSAAIGTDQLPANMPKSFLKNEGVRSISNLAELQVYHLEIMDQLIGKFPIELEIKDTDPLSPGDQTKKVVLQNLAESIAELFGLAINGASDNAIQTSAGIKNLLEITLVRQAVLQNYYRLDAILDYLGAGLEEDEATFNSTISLPKDPNNISEDVADFLQQSEIKFAYDKLANPKDTLTAKLLPIQKAADIIKAKYWKGFGKAGGDYTGAIKEWLKTYDPKNEQNETDWKDKIDKILEEYAKDQAGNIDKDRMPEIQNIKQIGSEPVPEPEAKK